MKKNYVIGFTLILCIVLAGCSSSQFDIVGMWKSNDGTIISFSSNGSCSPTLFGFSGGPSGSYTLSSKKDEKDRYTMQATHLTGGNLTFKVTVINENQIDLDLTSEKYFSASHLSLKRQ